MRDHVRFTSTEFAPPAAEPGQINPERYGYTLATWVAARLGERGFTADHPTAEDWGWLVSVRNEGQLVHVGCGNVDGSVTEWLVWVDAPSTGLLARLRRRRVAPNAAYGVAAALHGALQSSPRVTRIEWFRSGPRGQEIDHAPTPI